MTLDELIEEATLQRDKFGGHIEVKITTDTQCHMCESFTRGAEALESISIRDDRGVRYLNLSAE